MKDAIAGFFIAIAVAGGGVLWTSSYAGLDFTLYVLPVAACLAALLMPSRYFLAGYAFLFMVAAVIVYAQHVYVTSLPSYTGSPGEAIGLAFLMLTVFGVTLGAVLNIVFRLCWRRWGTGSP
jgi:hypothetical protein